MTDENLPKPQIIELRGGVKLAPVVGKATLRTRTNFAGPHLMAAARFSRHVAEVEADNEGKPFGGFYDEIREFSSASVLCGVAAYRLHASGVIGTEMWGSYL